MKSREAFEPDLPETHHLPFDRLMALGHSVALSTQMASKAGPSLSARKMSLSPHALEYKYIALYVFVVIIQIVRINAQLALT